MEIPCELPNFSRSPLWNSPIKKGIIQARSYKTCTSTSKSRKNEHKSSTLVKEEKRKRHWRKDRIITTVNRRNDQMSSNVFNGVKILPYTGPKRPTPYLYLLLKTKLLTVKTVNTMHWGIIYFANFTKKTGHGKKMQWYKLKKFSQMKPKWNSKQVYI